MNTTTSDRCRALLEQLSRYIDDDLSPAERRALTAHLRRCPCCQTMADSLKHTVDACRKAGTTRLPADVRQIIERNARRFVGLQRQDMEAMDRHAREALPGHGSVRARARIATLLASGAAARRRT